METVKTFAAFPLLLHIGDFTGNWCGNTNLRSDIPYCDVKPLFLYLFVFSFLEDNPRTAPLNHLSERAGGARWTTRTVWNAEAVSPEKVISLPTVP
jgi:hypothetical protein